MIELIKEMFSLSLHGKSRCRRRARFAVRGAAWRIARAQALFHDRRRPVARRLRRAGNSGGCECRAVVPAAVPVVIAAAFLLLRINQNSKIKGDAAIALISSSALAIGVVTVSLTTGMNTDVSNYMFGSILLAKPCRRGAEHSALRRCALMFVLLYPRIFAVTFDETFARATGTKAQLINSVIAVLTAVTVVIGMRMMGALLISSLIIFPALTAMRICRSFKGVVICSAVVSVVCFVIGMAASYAFSCRPARR